MWQGSIFREIFAINSSPQALWTFQGKKQKSGFNQKFGITPQLHLSTQKTFSGGVSEPLRLKAEYGHITGTLHRKISISRKLVKYPKGTAPLPTFSWKQRGVFCHTHVHLALKCPHLFPQMWENKQDWKVPKCSFLFEKWKWLAVPVYFLTWNERQPCVKHDPTKKKKVQWCLNINLHLYMKFKKWTFSAHNSEKDSTVYVWVRPPCTCLQPVGCGLECGPSPAACAAAGEPGSVFGPADPGPVGRLPSASLGTTGHPGNASATRGRGLS